MYLSLCNKCVKEKRIPDCGAKESDYKVIKGVGVTECKQFKEIQNK